MCVSQERGGWDGSGLDTEKQASCLPKILPASLLSSAGIRVAFPRAPQLDLTATSVSCSKLMDALQPDCACFVNIGHPVTTSVQQKQPFEDCCRSTRSLIIIFYIRSKEKKKKCAFKKKKVAEGTETHAQGTGGRRLCNKEPLTDHYAPP